MSHLKQTNLNVQGEAVEGHGADEGDPGGHRVHDLRVPVEPEPLQLGQHVQRLELLQVEDLGVREPELLDEGHVHRDPLRLGLLGVIMFHHTVSDPYLGIFLFFAISPLLLAKVEAQHQISYYIFSVRISIQ